MNGRFVAAMLFALGASSALRGDGGFERGHVFVAVSEPESCDFGGREWIVEVDPDTGAWSVFADSDDGLCVVSGLRFTPDGTRLLAANAGHLLKSFDGGWIRAFRPDGTSEVLLDESDGLSRPYGSNCIAFDSIGDFYVVNSLAHTILRFPRDGGPANVFADRFEGIFDRGAIDFAPNGDLFYCGDLARRIIRLTPDGKSTFFDTPPYAPYSLSFDRLGNLFVSAIGAVFAYPQACPQSRVPFGSGFGSALNPLAVSSNGQTVFVGQSRRLYRIQVEDGVTEIVGDFDDLSSLPVLISGVTVFEPRVRGDLDFDGDVDIEDFGQIQRCWMAANAGAITAGCLASDLDFDHAVGPADLQLLLASLTGPFE